MFLPQFHNLVSKFKEDFSETETVLIINCILDDSDKFSAFQELKNLIQLSKNLTFSSWYKDESSIEPTETSNSSVVVQIEKNFPTNETYYFYEESAVKILENRNLFIERIFINAFQSNKQFSTNSFELFNYENSSGDEYTSERKEFTNPNKLIDDYVNSRELTETLDAWILKQAPVEGSIFFEKWKEHSCKRLLGALCNIISSSNDEEVIFCFGRPSDFKVSISKIEIELFDLLQKLAKWVYFSGKDCEVRHLILSNEISKNHSINISLEEILTKSFETCRVAYDAHVISSTKETLSVLADLRKNTIEEAQRFSQKSNELITTLWKDVAIATVPFAFQSVASKYSLNDYVPCTYYLIAILILFTTLIQTSITASYFKLNEKAKKHWIESVSGYLSSTDVNEIIINPLSKLNFTFKFVCWSVRVIAFSIFCFLTYVGWHIEQ